MQIGKRGHLPSKDTPEGQPTADANTKSDGAHGIYSATGDALSDSAISRISRESMNPIWKRAGTQRQYFDDPPFLGKCGISLGRSRARKAARNPKIADNSQTAQPLSSQHWATPLSHPKRAGGSPTQNFYESAWRVVVLRN